MTSTTRPPAHLSWGAAGMLPDDIREGLLGAGAPFELVREPVLGVVLDVFARRPTHLIEVLRAAVDDDPDAIFLVDDDRTWTYRQTFDKVNAIAGHLVHVLGVAPGDRVATVSANSAEYGLVLWAILSAGAIVTSLNGWWTTSELEHGIRLTSPSLLLGDERRLSRIDRSPAVADLPILRLDELVAAATEGNTPALGFTGPTDEDDPAVILFTSGTTGRPKGATLSHRNLIHFCMASQLGTAIGEVLLPAPSPPARPAVILSSPLFHVSGLINLVMSGPALRTKLVFPPPGRWDETNHLELTTEHGITTWSGVPTQFLRLLRHPQFDSYDLSGLTRIGSGALPSLPNSSGRSTCASRTPRSATASA